MLGFCKIAGMSIGFLAAAGLVTSASALTVKKKIEIGASPDKVWSSVGDFCGIAAWHPAVAKCELSDKDGKVYRTLTLKGGGTIVERQNSRNDAKRMYSYSIIESPLPVTDYASTIRVKGSSKTSTVTWEGRFKAKGASKEKAIEVVSGIYEAGLKGIAEKSQ